jgi:hypothetical protein
MHVMFAQIGYMFLYNVVLEIMSHREFIAPHETNLMIIK